MFNFSIIVFVIGWVLWFLVDKHPASLGVLVPGELDSLLDNFQLAFDLLSDGFLRASFVFIWKAHYIVLSLIVGLLVSVLFDAAGNAFRRRHLRQLMWPKKTTIDKRVNEIDKQDID